MSSSLRSSELACAGGGLERALGPSLHPYDNVLGERFGFLAYLAREDLPGPELRQAWAARNQDLGQMVVPLEPERVLVNDDLIYLPYPYFTFGLGGFLFERRTGRGGTVHHPFSEAAVDGLIIVVLAGRRSTAGGRSRSRPSTI